jgi:autotransporter-associated beta strand protein
MFRNAVRSMRAMGLAFLVLATMSFVAPAAASACSMASYVWDGGGGANTSWTTASNWVTNAVPTAGQTVCIPAGFEATWDAAAAAPGLVAVSSTSMLEIAPGMTFTSGNLTLDPGASVYSYGTLAPANIAIGAGATMNVDGGILQPTAGASITGSGTLAFGDSTAPSTGELGGTGALTIDGPETTVGVDAFDINGRTVTLASSTLEFPVAATVTKDSAGSLTIASGATLVRSGLAGTMTLPSLVNHGTVHVEFYELDVTGSNDVGTAVDGTYEVDAGATLTLSGQRYVDGATFTGAGSMTATNDVSLVGDMTIASGATFTSENLMMGSGAVHSVLASSTSCTTCTLRLAHGAGDPTLSGVTLGQGITVSQESDVNISGVVGTTTLDGTWQIASNGMDFLDDLGFFTIGSTGRMTVDCGSGGTCVLDLPNTGVENNGVLEVTRGTLQLTNLIDYASGTLAAGGTYRISAGAKLDLPANGRITANAAMIELNGAGAQIRETGVTGSIFDTIATNTGSFTLTGGAVLGTSAAPFSSSGTLVVGSGSTLTGATTITGGTLSLGGTISGALTVSGGTMSIANAPSTAAVTGSFALASGGTLATRIAGSGSSAHDALTVSGAASFAGALTVNAAGYAPAATDAIRLVSSGSASGSPSSTTVASLSSPWTLATSVDATGLVLAATESDAPSAPGTPATTSDHSSTTVTFDSTVDIAWSAASDGAGSGVAGYSVEFSQAATTDPDTTIDATGLTATSSELAEGWWYAHVRAIDAEGTASTSTHSSMFYVGVHATGCTASGATRLSMTGTSGADRLVGTSARNTMRGYGGADTIVAGSGIDRVYGGAGGDVLCLGTGSDIAYGEGGADRILGASGNDTINPGAGADTVIAGAGADRINSNDGARDAISCGTGIDVVVADSRDRLSGCELVVRR